MLASPVAMAQGEADAMAHPVEAGHKDSVERGEEKGWARNSGPEWKSDFVCDCWKAA